MHPNFWHDRWRTNNIRFHEQRPNAMLVRNLPALGLAQGSRVFVPLCGKSLDMHYLLAQGMQVVGVELSPLAVEQLFAELGVSPRKTILGPLERQQVGPLTVFVGNLFDLDAATLGPVDAVYDRAALVALPADMRSGYAKQMVALAGAAPQLLICFEYPEGAMQPPPHSLGPADVQAHYGHAYDTEVLERSELPEGMQGKRPVYEGVYLLSPR